jgi:hypothetical protein
MSEELAREPRHSIRTCPAQARDAEGGVYRRESGSAPRHQRSSGNHADPLQRGAASTAQAPEVDANTRSITELISIKVGKAFEQERLHKDYFGSTRLLVILVQSPRSTADV